MKNMLNNLHAFCDGSHPIERGLQSQKVLQIFCFFLQRLHELVVITKSLLTETIVIYANYNSVAMILQS